MPDFPAEPGQRYTFAPDGRLFVTLLSNESGFPRYPEELQRRAEEVLYGTSLVEMVLYGHLLHEQALEILIKKRFARSNVFERGRFANLTFAQKITVWVGLYAPEEDLIDRLQRFNRLRNRMAHSLADLSEVTCRELPADLDGPPLHRARWAFLQVAWGLGVIQGVRWSKFKE
jgi:hypothetical protein